MCSLAIFLTTLAVAQDTKPPEPGVVVHADPSALIPSGVEFRGDVAFLPPDRAETLDLYLPKNRAAGTKSPGIVIIHGGAWKGGNKRAGREIDSGTTFALAGYVCASVEYDKTPGNWPRNLLDCKNAVRFLRSHADELGVDSRHIGVIGGSAGGHLAMMVAFTPHVAELEPSAPYPSVRDDVSACVNMYGPADLFLQMGVKEAAREGEKKLEMFDPGAADLDALWRLASPLNHVRKGGPPVLTLQGAMDEIVKPAQATALEAKLAGSGIEHQTVIIPGTGHTFTLHSVKTMDIAALTVAFFDRHLKPAAALRVPAPIPGARADEGDLPPEVRAWASACKQAPPPLHLRAVTQLVGRMKAEKLWDKCGLLLFFAAHEATPGAFNLKGCPNGELAGKPEHLPGRALKGNGTDASFDTRLFLKDIPGFTLTNHGIYAYSADDVPGAFSIAGASGGGPMVVIRPRNLGWLGVWTGTPTQAQVGPITSGVGLGGYSRFSATDGIWVKDKLSGPMALTAAKWPSSTLRILRHGSMSAYYPGGVSFVFAGAALTAGEAAALGACFDECLATLGTLAGIRVPPKPAYAGPGAFRRGQIIDVRPAGMKVFALTPPPASDEADETGYYHFPLHYAVCRPWSGRDSTSTKVKCLELIWSDRALGPKPGVISDIPFKKGNDTSGVITLSNNKGTGRTEFDSYELAIGAMLGRTAYSAGLRPFDDRRCMWKGKAMGWCDWLAHWGYDVAAWRALAAKSADVGTDPVFTTDAGEDTGGIIMHRGYVAAHADEIFTQPSFNGGTIFARRNIVILGPGRAIDDGKFAGFIMDLEHADGRPPEMFAASMEMWAHIIHSIRNPDGTNRFFASTTGHELDSGTGKLAGWDASTAHRVYEALDYVCVNVGNPRGRSVEERVQAQLNILRGPKGDQPVGLNKIMLQVHIGMGGDQLQMPDAIAVRDWLQAHPGIGGLFEAPVGANFKAPPDDIVSRLRGTILGLVKP